MAKYKVTITDAVNPPVPVVRLDVPKGGSCVFRRGESDMESHEIEVPDDRVDELQRMGYRVEDPEEKWPHELSPEAYLSRHPEGPSADLARSLIDEEG